jgi:ABC-type transport system involved in cytochrome c biogenesis permease subunit
LASHVFLVTLGYLTVFLTGALGICYVCRRCFSDFSVSRAQSIRRATVIFSSVATGLTTAGVILGAIWAKAEWGRYWTWDPKETGALCVIVWMILFVCADRVSRFSVRTILVMSILGNVIVSLAWFGANLWASLHSYGTQYYLMLLLAVVISNLAAFVIGLGPAGWLRLRKV